MMPLKIQAEFLLGSERTGVYTVQIVNYSSS